MVGLRWVCVAVWMVALVGVGCDRPTSHKARSGLAANPETLDFGVAALGVTKTMKVRLTNQGRAPFTVQGATTSLPNVEVVPFEAFELRAGGEREVEVRFTADVEGKVQGILEVLTDADNVARLGMAGQGVKAWLDVPARTLDFGNVELGSVALREVLVRNPSRAETPVRVDLDGMDMDQFGSSEAGNTFVLQPGEERLVPVAFTPDRLGSAQALGRVSVVCPTCEPSVVTLQGTGVAGRLEVTPLRVEFGRVPIGATVQETITVRNLGTEPMAYGGVKLLDNS
ncbi:MAG TPA: choice-of-anchor D domain-containing protein, partial [Myxococcaceae bacterium]|nr:choice-of-anchor D domain-containing protein [Myxococcaceae bacterium]